MFSGFPSGTTGKEPACQAGHIRDVGLISGLERYPGGENGNLLQYSHLKYLMDKGA